MVNARLVPQQPGRSSGKTWLSRSARDADSSFSAGLDSRVTMAAREETWSLMKIRRKCEATVQELISRTDAIARDLHAGSFGGAVANPAEALAALVASLHNKAGRVAVPGFYGQVRPMTEAERRHLARAGPSDSALLAPAAVAGHGEPGFSAFERVTRRPSVVATNLRTSGAGRTVVPAWAAADLNVRLVASQQPGTVASALRRHLRAGPRPASAPGCCWASACPMTRRTPRTSASTCPTCSAAPKPASSCTGAWAPASALRAPTHRRG